MLLVGNFSKLHMDYPQIVADRFDELVELYNQKKDLKREFVDDAIFEIVCFRCHTDIGGHLDPFEQFFKSEDHFDSFISIFEKLNEKDLKSKFLKVKALLSQISFWDNRDTTDHHEKDNIELFQILEDIDNEQLLWKIDEKLGKIFSKT